MSYYIHHVPGRLRIKSPVIKNNKFVAEELKKCLSTLYGIATIDINTTTGSLLINYNKRAINYNEIINLLERKGYFDSSKALTNDDYLHQAASKAGAVIGKSIFSTFTGMALKETPLSFLAILI